MQKHTLRLTLRKLLPVMVLALCVFAFLGGRLLYAQCDQGPYFNCSCGKRQGCNFDGRSGTRDECCYLDSGGTLHCAPCFWSECQSDCFSGCHSDWDSYADKCAEPGLCPGCYFFY